MYPVLKKRVDQDYLVSDQDPHCFSLLVHVCFYPPTKSEGYSFGGVRPSAL